MSIRIYGATSGYVDLDAPAVAGSASVTLPGSGTLALTSALKVLQVVRATDTTLRSTTSTSYVDVTGMSVTITPQKSDSTVLVIAVFYAIAEGTVSNRGKFQITDSSNNAISGAEAVEFGTNSNSLKSYDGLNLVAYATPATTSAVTYKLRFLAEVASTTMTVQNAATTGQLYAIEVAA